MRRGTGEALSYDLKTFHHFPVFDDLDAVAVLPDDGARIAADERVAPDVFAALDGFKQERFALPA